MAKWIAVIGISFVACPMAPRPADANVGISQSTERFSAQLVQNIGTRCDSRSRPTGAEVCLRWPGGYLSVHCIRPSSEAPFATCPFENPSEGLCPGECPEEMSCLGFGSARFCVRNCVEDFDCRSGYTCRSVVPGTSVCMPPQSPWSEVLETGQIAVSVLKFGNS